MEDINSKHQLQHHKDYCSQFTSNNKRKISKKGLVNKINLTSAHSQIVSEKASVYCNPLLMHTLWHGYTQELQ